MQCCNSTNNYLVVCMFDNICVLSTWNFFSPLTSPSLPSPSPSPSPPPLYYPLLFSQLSWAHTSDRFVVVGNGYQSAAVMYSVVKRDDRLVTLSLVWHELAGEYSGESDDEVDDEERCVEVSLVHS